MYCPLRRIKDIIISMYVIKVVGPSGATAQKANFSTNHFNPPVSGVIYENGTDEQIDGPMDRPCYTDAMPHLK